MEKNYETDDFLAKWASGELSEVEKEAFKKTEDFKYYQAILEGTEVLEVPPYSNEKLFKGVQEKILEEPKVISLIPKWAYAVAASVALLIGYVFFINNTVDYETGFGEQLAITLPDNSEVILNAKSQLEYKKRSWGTEDRTVFLSGEAYFKVEKGSRFSVESAKGTVSVLGTQFTVNSTQNTFEVICFEGKVRVERREESEIITKGEALRWAGSAFESFSLADVTPTWLQEESGFTNAPLNQVIKALENQYAVSIDQQNIDVTLRFTGSFTHGNLETALRTVFESMDITFTFEDKSHIVLSKR